MGVGEHRANRSSVRERRQAASLRKWPIGSDNARQTGERHIENCKQIIVPLPLDDIEELSARGVAGLDHGLTAKARQKIGVDRPYADLAGFRARLSLREAVEQPAGLGCGEHRVERQSAAAADHSAVSGSSQRGADRLGSLILPREDGR